MGILSWIVVGAIAGWLASMVMKTNASQGLIADIIVGIIGGVVGNFVLNLIAPAEDRLNGITIESILVAFIGAVIFLGILRMIRR